MQQENHIAFFKLLFFISLALTSTFSSCQGKGMTVRCVKNVPSIKQTQVGKAKYKVDVINNCGTCPVIDIHVKCGSFPQTLVKSTSFRVLKFDDCVVNSGLPLSPLQTFSFTYSHPTMYYLSPKTWYFQCE